MGTADYTKCDDFGILAAKTKIQLSDLSCWWKVKAKWWFNYCTFQIKLKYIVSHTQKEIQNCLRTMIRSLPLGGSIPHQEIITRQSLSQNTIVRQAQNILSQLPFHCGYSVGVGCWGDGVCTLVTKLQPLSPDLHPHHKKKQQNNTTKSDEIMLFSRAFQRWLIAFNSNKKLFKSLTALTIYSSFDEIENRCNLRFGCICFNLLSEQCG